MHPALNEAIEGRGQSRDSPETSLFEGDYETVEWKQVQELKIVS